MYQDFNKKIGFSSLLLALFGLALLLWPSRSLVLLCTIVGWVMLIVGGGLLIRHLVLKEYGLSISLMGDVTGLICGLCLVLRPITTASLVPAIIGLLLILSGALNVYQAFRMRQYSFTRFLLSLLFSLITIGLALTLVLYPFAGATAMVRIIGFLLLFHGLTNAWTAWKLSQY